MPPLLTILIVLAIAIAAVLMITSRNPTTMTEEQTANFSKWFRILIPIMLIAAAIRFFVGG